MNGGDVITLRRNLGHTNLAMTELHLHLTNAQRQSKHDQCSPVGKLNLKTLCRPVSRTQA